MPRSLDNLIASFRAAADAAHDNHLEVVRNRASTLDDMIRAREASAAAHAALRAAECVAAHVRSGA